MSLDAQSRGSATTVLVELTVAILPLSSTVRTAALIHEFGYLGVIIPEN
jgi:hypothetical protein